MQDLLARLNWTVADLSARTGVDPKTVRDWIARRRGRTAPPPLLAALEAAADAVARVPPLPAAVRQAMARHDAAIEAAIAKVFPPENWRVPGPGPRLTTPPD
jgi:transcriptional regulator with XRE-family HTH domain